MKMIAISIFAALAYIAVVALFCWLPFHLLWNWLMPSLFELPRLGWEQSLGLLLLSGLIFRSGASSTRRMAQKGAR